MQTGIGARLREARKRRKIDLSTVEAAIKIRARHLQAMENEEWDQLPGGVYTRSFIRTYAGHLGLDGERLAEEYRHATLPDEQPRAAVPASLGSAGAGLGRPGALRAVLVAAGLVVVVVAIALLSDGGTPDSGSGPGSGGIGIGESAAKAQTEAKAKPGIAVELTAKAEIWVCLLDANDEPLVNGQILAAGAEEGPFRSQSFAVSFGNGEISMRVDGRAADIPPSSSPIGYVIRPDGGLEPLSEGERPTCT